ncbi:cell division protein FtsH, partial [Mesorhizobium sp. M8A.F.Ca.ET.181.01.1.1]
MARHMVTRYGMSKRIGLATVGGSPEQMASQGLDRWRGSFCSDDTARLVDEEIRTMLDHAHTRVSATLATQRASLERIARLLREREVLDQQMLQEAIRGVSTERAPATAAG